MSRVWEQLQWHPSDRSEEFRIAGAYFYSLLSPFYVLILKRHAVAVFHLTVTLQMMSNSRRSLCEWWVRATDPYPHPHPHQYSLADRSSRRRLLFPSQKGLENGGNHPVSNITLEFFIQGVTYLLKNESYMYSIDSREWCSIVTYHSQSNCQMRNRQSTHFLN